MKKNTRAKNKFLFFIFYYFFFLTLGVEKMCINFGITVIFFKKMTVTKKKFMNLFLKKKKMTVTKIMNLFPLKKNIFFKKMTVITKFIHIFLGVDPEKKNNKK